MIVYRLACREGHAFEGWFASAQACEREAREGRLACPACGSAQVERRPSAPYVHASGGERASAQPAPDAVQGAAREKALRALKTYLLAHTDDVGREFPEIARRIHYGEETGRGIRGRVTAQEAEELREEGIAALALPAELVLGDEVH